MSDIIRANRLFKRFLHSIIVFSVSFLIFNSSTYAQDRDILPFSIKIEARTDGIIGDTISLEIIKTGGTEEAHGFTFKFGYDTLQLTDPAISYGEIYDEPGEYEWELLGYDIGPFPECEAGGCPSGLIEVGSLAETVNGPHSPLTDPKTGRIKVIADGTVLFSIRFNLAAQIDPEETFLPVFFFWSDCQDNQIAFTYEYDGPFDIRSALSYEVYDNDGLPGWSNITDYDATLPTKKGLPSDCTMPDLPERFCIFFNGGITGGCADANSDGAINILDVIFLIAYKYKGGPSPEIPERCDFNSDSTIDILDIVCLLNYKYKDGPLPQCSEL